MTWGSSLAPLTLAGFRSYLVGRTISLLGNTLAPVAVAFGVLHIGGSASDLGLVLAARGAAQVILLLFGGVLADRFSRQRVLVWACTASGVVQGVAAVMLLTGEATVGTLAAVEALQGAVSAFTLPAMTGVVPLVVPPAQWQQANALTAAGRNGAMVLGPSLGGIMVATAGAGWALAVNAATYLVAALYYSRMNLPNSDRAAASNTWGELRAGWAEFTAHTWLWAVVLGSAIMNALYAGAWITLGPVIAEDTIGPAGWGIALSAMAAGMFLGTLLMLRVSWRRPLRSGMLGIILVTLPISALGFPSQFTVLLVAAVMGGIGFEIFGINWETALQENIPEDKLSRVSSYDMLGSFAAIPLGQVLAGVAAAAFEPRQVVVTAATLYLATGVLLLLTPAVWRLRRKVRCTGVPA